MVIIYYVGLRLVHLLHSAASMNETHGESVFVFPAVEQRRHLTSHVCCNTCTFCPLRPSPQLHWTKAVQSFIFVSGYHFFHSSATHDGFPTRPEHFTWTSYRVERTLDSKGQNWIMIFFTAFKTTVAFLGAAMFPAQWPLTSPESDAPRADRQRAPEDKQFSGVDWQI